MIGLALLALVGMPAGRVLVDAGGIAYRDFISAGSVVLSALVVAFGSIQVALIQRGNHKTDKVAKEAHKAAKEVGHSRTAAADNAGKLDEVAGKLGEVVDRLDQQDRRTLRRDDWWATELRKFHDRVDHLERKMHENHPDNS